MPLYNSARQRPTAPCLGLVETEAQAVRVRSMDHRRNALPTPPGVARRRCESQKRGKPGGQRIVASRVCSGRRVGSDEMRWVAVSASPFIEVAYWLGTGGSPGNLSSWWLASQPKASGGASSSCRMYRGRLRCVSAASSSSACQVRSRSLVASARGRLGITLEVHRRRIVRAR